MPAVDTALLCSITAANGATQCYSDASTERTAECMSHCSAYAAAVVRTISTTVVPAIDTTLLYSISSANLSSKWTANNAT